jgi:hypothetical protein
MPDDRARRLELFFEACSHVRDALTLFGLERDGGDGHRLSLMVPPHVYEQLTEGDDKPDDAASFMLGDTFVVTPIPPKE